MAIGYLHIQARTANDALPLSNVQISVTDKQGNRVYELTTDESGETQKIPLETLNQSFSQNPYYSGLPYTSYNVLARKNGFNTLYVTDIPIFDGETALLPLAFVPMQILQRSPAQTQISVGKPAVAMQETRNQEGATIMTAMRRRPLTMPALRRSEAQNTPPAPRPESLAQNQNMTFSPTAESQALNQNRVPSTMAESQALNPNGVPSTMAESQALNPNGVPSTMAESQALNQNGVPSTMAESQALNQNGVPSTMAEPLTPNRLVSPNLPSSLSEQGQDTLTVPESMPNTQGQPSIGLSFPGAQEYDNDPRILRQVVIPNPITVHLGTPNASASNVQVSFPDYVKNVASSEIYPTWPDSAMRANIYAIITFALNRVFTEWYRSRGYQFDITNSTAYDQAFIYGRPIYDSISRIVDEIFNQYVRRAGQNAPYFTSFCNGTTATCQGLSQWGTVSLANQGLSPIEILRSYYPKDVEIASTNIVTGVLSSYPGTPLRVGSRGLDVQTIQTYLNRIRQNYPAIPVITDETGVFQDSTRAAVTSFQRIFNLTPDGIVGKATWYKISSIYAGIARLAELNSEGTSLGIGSVPPSSVLRQGSRGQDVITLQYLLNVISEYYPGIPAPAQDGVFGSGTRQSVMAFQQYMGLQTDGAVGPLTWDSLYNAYQGILQNVPLPGPGTVTPPGSGSGAIRYVVKAGDSLWQISRKYGTTVEELKRLNGLTSDLLNIGQVLQIPVSQNGSYVEYTVRPGDSLWTISRKYGTTVEAIMKLNGLTSDALGIGQILKIPV